MGPICRRNSTTPSLQHPRHHTADLCCGKVRGAADVACFDGNGASTSRAHQDTAAQFFWVGQPAIGKMRRMRRICFCQTGEVRKIIQLASVQASFQAHRSSCYRSTICHRFGSPP
jgi:hypothetical protein